MALHRKCSEPGCDNLLVKEDGTSKPAGTKTCSQACRQKRARRIKASQKRQGRPRSPEESAVAAVVNDNVKDAAHEVMKEELRPVVRESMTADVLASIGQLVALTPRAIQKLEADLESGDENVRQRAYTLLLRYTMGNPSVAPPPAEQQAAPLQVVFNVPRPGDTTAPGLESPTDGEAEELRICGDCHQQKGESQFIGASERCADCFAALQERLERRFAKEG